MLLLRRAKAYLPESIIFLKIVFLIVYIRFYTKLIVFIYAFLEKTALITFCYTF